MFIIPLIKYEYSLVSRHNTNISVKASASNVSFEVSILYSFRSTSYILFPEKRRDGKGYRGESVTFFNENFDPQRSLRLGTELFEYITAYYSPQH